MRRWLVLAVLAVLVFGGVGAVTAATESPDQQSGLVQEDIDAEEVVMEIQLHADGSATWTIEHRIPVNDENATEGFNATRERIEENRSSFREPFAQRVRGMATRAQDQTGRTMVVENISVDAYRGLDQESGIVAYQFRWYGFAETGDNLQIGDALSGLFLDEQTKLLVTWPDETSLAEVSPEPDDRRESSVVWNGPVDFASGEPRLTLESDSTSFGPDLSFGAESNDVFITISLFLLVVGSLGAGVVVFVRRHRTDDEETEAEVATDAASEAAADEAADSDESETAATDSEAAAETESAADGVAAATETEAADDAAESADQGETEPPEELLSNEERVLKLLDDSGGRVKQQEIVETFDWSETKTSEVVSDLREAEEIEVYRLGRENVLALPDTGLGLDTDDDSEGETE